MSPLNDLADHLGHEAAAGVSEPVPFTGLPIAEAVAIEDQRRREAATAKKGVA